MLMKPIRTFPLVLAVALGTCLGTGSSRLAADELRAPATVAPTTQRQAPNSTQYVLQIADGMISEKGTKVPATLGHVVDALRELYDGANIVASPEVMDLRLADLKLRWAGLQETLEALRVASGERFLWRRNDEAPATIDPTTGLPVPARQEKESDLYLLTADPHANPPTTKREVEVFNLSGYIAYSTAQAGKQPHDEAAVEGCLRTVQDIVRSTLDQVFQQDGAGRLDYRFHAGADLLIVIGPREQIEIARKVVEALPGQPLAGSGKPRGESAAWGPPSDAAAEQQREVFMRRYGLSPQRAPGAGAPASKPDAGKP